MTKRQDLCLQRRSRPEQSDQRQPNQAANISHQPGASPDSTSLASRIEFPTMTGERLREAETERNSKCHRGHAQSLSAETCDFGGADRAVAGGAQQDGREPVGANQRTLIA